MATTNISVFVAKMDREQFRSNILMGNNHSCWEWDGHASDDYPSYKGYPAYKIIYRLDRREPAKGSVIYHVCGNKWCCNPIHLALGTMSDVQKNVDRSAKTRERNREKRFEKYGSDSAVLARIDE